MPGIEIKASEVKCYLCSERCKIDYINSKFESLPICPNCIFTHLGYEIKVDGNNEPRLIKIDNWDNNFGEITTEKGKKLKYISI